MKIQKLDRTTMRLLGAAIEEALKPIAAQFDIELKYTGGNFERDGSQATVKIKADVKIDGSVIPEYVRSWNTLHEISGFKREHLHATIQLTGMRYTIEGLKAGRQLKVVIKNVATGKNFLIDTAMALDALKEVA